MGAQGETAPRMIRHNLYYQSDYVDELISFRVHTGGVGYWQDVVSDENLFFSPLDSIRLGDLMGAHRRSTGQDKKSVIADPMFVDLANGDFRMSPESPAFKLGIKQIDLGNVGLRGRRGKRTGM
jgi:hypothetical protein